MKTCLGLLCLFSFTLSFGQHIQADSQTYTPQQLIEDILIASNCIEDVVVTNAIGGNFNNSDESYGFFDATGTTFPFLSGIVLSTGRLVNTQGPNTTLSDDDAPNWVGDTDLEVILNESNTLNATIIEFDFTAIASQINFRYIFASEEYQENDPNTCQFSDLFGFLIRPISDSQYTNIALIPNTQTPVKVTTVHPEIPNGCQAENEAYFESFNGTIAPINFNGQTKILNATANTIANERYHVKLVIADEQNFRYDSAVFLEAGSFQLSTDLGPDLLVVNGTALCENETFTLNAFESGINRYSWYKDGALITIFSDDPDGSSIEVTEPGVYNVEIELEGSNCIAYGEVIIEYAPIPLVSNSSMVQCDINTDGLTTYNLYDQDLVNSITINDNNLLITNYFLTLNDANQNINPIPDSGFFNNTIPNQIVYARVENPFGCFTIAEVVLDTSNQFINIAPQNLCDDETADGQTEFNLSEIRILIEPLVPVGAIINFHSTIDDAFNNVTPLSNNYENLTPYNETIYALVLDGTDCFSIIPITLNVLENPEILPNEEFIYCLNSFPNTLNIIAGIINDSPNNYTYEWLLDGNLINDTSSEINISTVGIYTVIATGLNGCTATRNITILPSNLATIDDIIIVDASTNNTITVMVSGEGSYEFNINNGPYQDSSIFEQVEPGFHTIQVRDKNGCGVIEAIVSVFGFPKFFTPNGDSYNDTWKPLGVNEQNNPNIKVLIFNKLGKLLKEINPLDEGWDGTFNGQYLPNDDYWFYVILPNGKEYRGHFSLKR